MSGNFEEVFQQFDRDLFEYLTPSSSGTKVIEYTGSEKGDRVHLELLFGLKLKWVSLITESARNEQKAYFVDEGITLPWPLKYWRHEHIVWANGQNKSTIHDQISYRTGTFLMDLLVYPALYGMFFLRKNKYREYFNGQIKE